MNEIAAIVHERLMERMLPFVRDMVRTDYEFLYGQGSGAPIALGILPAEPQRHTRASWNERGRWVGEHLLAAPEPLTKRQRRRARGRAKQSRHPTRS